MYPNYQYCLEIGPSDRYAAVLKSHVRRFLNEGHDVTTASQFVSACASYGGVKNVQVFECQLPLTHSKTKFKINDITKLHNFIYKPTIIQSYRAWNIGSGKPIMLDKSVDISSVVKSPVCVSSSSEPDYLVNSCAKDLSYDVVSKSARCSDTDDQTRSKSKLFFCDYEWCICRFLNYGNLLRHIAAGNHIERVEKSLMKDLAIITYKAKLDAANYQDHLSLELEKVNFNPNNYAEIPSLNQGWALPIARKVQRLTPKVQQFLRKKFDDGLIKGIRWQLEAVVYEMKHEKDPKTGLYLFDLSELVKVGTVRSFFSRQKANSDKVNAQKSSILENNSEMASEQQDVEEDTEEEAFQDQLAIDLEVQHADIRGTVDKKDVIHNTSGAVTGAIISKRMLSSLENENLSHPAKTPRFPPTQGQ